jgi:hypothetical protein
LQYISRRMRSATALTISALCPCTALLVSVRSLFYILLQAKQDFAPAGVAEREIRVTVGPNRCR